MVADGKSNFTILDHINDIKVPGNVFKEPANEYWALVCLWDGMEYLYRQVSKVDHAVKQRVNPNDELTVFLGGNAPEFLNIPRTLVTCSFHWYAISACQYVKTVGSIAYRLDRNRPLSHKYAREIIPAVIPFRDKVAAHFAWCTANNRDNDAERLASILPQLTFIDDSFCMGSLTVALRRGSKTANSATLKPWSLCKVHESLRARFWPQSSKPSKPTDLADDRPDEALEQPT